MATGTINTQYVIKNQDSSKHVKKKLKVSFLY